MTPSAERIRPMKLSIVIPVYNSARILPLLVDRIRASLESAIDPYEIVFVNDMSIDESWQVIQALGLANPAVKGISLRKNTGQHNAIMAGLNHATGDVVVVMDDDLQHPPEDIPLLYDKIRQGHDVCFGEFAGRHHARWKKLGSAFNDRVAQLLLKKPKDIYLSPFKAFSAEIRAEVIRYTGPFAYLDGLILMTTSRLTTIQVSHHKRHEGRSNYSLRKSLSLWAKMVTSFSVLPLRVVSIVGVFFAALGFSLASVSIMVKMFSSLSVPVGWTSLITVVLIIGGVQLLALGLIGEYLGRAYVRLNNIPQYSVKERVNL